MSNGMARKVPPDPTDRSAMGRAARPIPMAATSGPVGSDDGIRRLGGLLVRLPPLLLLDCGAKFARGDRQPLGGLHRNRLRVAEEIRHVHVREGHLTPH